MHSKRSFAHEKKGPSASSHDGQREAAHTSQGLIESLREKPGFAIAVAFALIVIVGVLYYTFFAVGPDTQLQAANKSNAKDLYSQNKLMLTESVTQVQTMFDANDPSPLTSIFSISIQQDLNWLLAKNDDVYASRPTELLIAKEIAFTTFLQRVIFVNQDFSYETGAANYQYMVDFAAGKETPVVTDANSLADFYQDIDVNSTLDLFYGDKQLESTFYTTTNTLLTQYVAYLRNTIATAPTIEEKYVAAKKLVYFVSNN